MKIYKIARCFNLKTGQKNLLFNYCLKNDDGSFLVKKMIKQGRRKPGEAKVGLPLSQVFDD